MEQVNRPSPIEDQVTEIILNQIQQGLFDQSGRLPSETELSKSLKVSRTTVRTALAILASRGLISRRHGEGTYINKQATEILSSSRWDFIQLVEKSGRKASITTMNTSHRPVSEQEATALEIKSGDMVVVLERVFKANDIPVIFSITVLPESLICHPYPENVWDESIFTFLDKYCDEQYTLTVVNISAVSVSPKIAKILDLKPASPIIQLDEVFYNNKSKPLFSAKNFFNDNTIQMRFSQTSF